MPKSALFQMNIGRNCLRYSTNVSENVKKPVYPPFHYPLTKKPTLNNQNKGNRYMRSHDLLYISNAVEKISFLKQSSPLKAYMDIPSLWNINIDILPLIKYITKTHLVKSLPDDYYQCTDKIGEANIKKGHHSLQSTIIKLFNSNFGDNVGDKLDIINKQLISSVIRICKSLTVNINSHIMDMIEDVDAHMQYTWMRGGYERDQHTPIRAFWQNENAFGFSYKTILDNYYRMRFPIAEICSLASELSTSEIEAFPYFPVHYGLIPQNMDYESNPGFWRQHNYLTYMAFSTFMGRRRRQEADRLIAENMGKNRHLVPHALFPFISFRPSLGLNRAPGVNVLSGLPRDQTLVDQVSPAQDSAYQRSPQVMDKVRASAIVDTYAWINTLAAYLGFTPFNDLTYPIVSQAVYTDGKNWDFFVYQLNTTNLWMEPLTPRSIKSDREENDTIFPDSEPTKNLRRNLCWNLADLKLFDTVQGNQIIGYNTEVLETCLKFFSNTPVEKSESDLMPYINPSTETIANFKYVC